MFCSSSSHCWKDVLQFTFVVEVWKLNKGYIVKITVETVFLQRGTKVVIQFFTSKNLCFAPSFFIHFCLYILFWQVIVVFLFVRNNCIWLIDGAQFNCFFVEASGLYSFYTMESDILINVFQFNVWMVLCVLFCWKL